MVVFCLAAAAPLAALAQDRQCEARVKSEVSRLEQQYAKQRPDPGDNAAQQRWQRQLQAALQAVAREAESCRERSRQIAEAERAVQAAQDVLGAQPAQPVRPPPAAASACLDQTRMLGEELARRYGGHELSPTEQLRLRNEQEKLSGQRQQCVQQP
jgi:hypothetical protein